MQVNPFDPGFYTSRELVDFGFKHVGENVLISKNVTIVGTSNVKLGNNVRIDGFTTIAASSGWLNLGDFVHIGGGSYLGCSGGLEMDSFSAVSHGVKIFSVSDDYSGLSLTNPTVPFEYTNRVLGLVRIGKHAIIGANTVVLPDLEVGEGCAVGALALVTKSLPEWTICQGNPAIPVRNRLKHLLRKEEDLLQSLGEKL